MQCGYCKHTTHHKVEGQLVDSETADAEEVPVTRDDILLCGERLGATIRKSGERFIDRDKPFKTVCGCCKGHHETMGEAMDCSRDARWAPRTRHGVIKEAARSGGKVRWNGKNFEVIGVVGDTLTLRTGASGGKDVPVTDVTLPQWEEVSA